MVVPKILVLIIVSLGFSPVCAEQNCDSLSVALSVRPTTLIELTDIALTCNPATRIAWAETKMSFANLGVALSTFWPTVSGIGTMQGISNSSISETSSSTATAKQQFVYGPGFSISYLLWDFGVRNQQVKAANYQLQAAKFTQNSVMQQTILQVEQAYYQVLGQKAVMVSLEESVTENKANLAAAVALRKQGMAVIGDVYQVQSALSQAQLNLEQAKGNFKILQGQLALAIGVPTETSIKLFKLSDKIETKLVLQPIHELMDDAKENRNDFLAADAQAKASEAQLEAVKRQRWPSIQLGMTTQRLYTSSANTANNYGSALLTFSVPIFSGFSQEYSIMQARAAKEKAVGQRDLLEQQVRLQVWQAYYQLETAANSIKTSETFLKSSLQAAKQAYGQYKEGVGTILTVLSSQATLDSARVQMTQAKLNWFTSLAQFSYAVGSLDG